MTKIVYIAHQLSGNIKDNVKSILAICRQIHTKEIIPFAPYLVSVQYLDDNIAEDRDLGIKANKEFFRRGIIDEVWLCGSKISKGMEEEITFAEENNIPVKFFNKELGDI